MIILFLVSILACAIGSVCGIGGGIIIKPVLDATGIMGVSEISFLSGCTVLVMTVVSIFLNIRSKATKLNFRMASLLAAGAAVGGCIGKSLFQVIKDMAGNDNLVGMIQAGVLTVITFGTLVYMLKQKSIRTRCYSHAGVCVAAGIALGIMSSFLGIGGGPINLVALTWLFSLSTKDAALCSLYIIMFSQAASLGQTVLTGTIPDVQIPHLLLMMAGGVSGGILGSQINKKIDDNKVNKAFIVLMWIIIAINIYNIIKHNH